MNAAPTNGVWRTRLLWATCLGQALYFLVTGAWPIVHMPSFLAVTGPKTDLWLVRTVGMQVIVVGLVLWKAHRMGVQRSTAIFLLGSASALGFIFVDVISVAGRTVRPIYLADALVQLLLLGGWIVSRIPPVPWPVARRRAGLA